MGSRRYSDLPLFPAAAAIMAEMAVVPVLMGGLIRRIVVVNVA